MGFLEVLTLIFIALKLFGVIAWSWWLVFLPMIIGVAIYLIIFGVVLIAGIRSERSFERDIKRHHKFLRKFEDYD